MSNKLPFDDAFKNKMNDLRAGNEDASWQKMKQLLEEKEERKPFAWLNLYTVCGCIIIVASLSFWIIVSHNHKQKSIDKTTNISISKRDKSSTQESQTNQNTTALKQAETNKTSAQDSNENASSNHLDKKITELHLAQLKHVSPLENNAHKKFNARPSVDANQTNEKNSNKELNGFSTTKKENSNLICAANSDSLLSVNNNKQSVSEDISATKNINPSLSSTEKIDSLETNMSVLNNLKQSSTADSASAKKLSPISLKQKLFFVEAGVQLKQQLPLSGQKITAYNYSGNKALLKDYIPAVFIKFEKNKQWFFQGEFSYATPYSVKQFSYSRHTKINYTSSIVTTTSNNLQKTYYTQTPLTFNYYVKPNWFVGTGVLYGWFHGAVAQQQTTTGDIKAGTFITTKTIMPFKNFTDSFLYKNQANLLLQTGYSLKRWSFILRYEKGAQPYIKYTIPNGAIENKRSSSVELNIDYRFIKAPL